MPSLSNWYPFKRPSLVPVQRPLAVVSFNETHVEVTQ